MLHRIVCRNFKTIENARKKNVNTHFDQKPTPKSQQCI